MNMPRQAPAMMPTKLYGFPTTLRPKGKESFALTAKTCGKPLDGIWRCEVVTYVETLDDEDRQVD